MKPARNLKLVQPQATPAQVVSEALAALDEARRDVRRLEETIAAEGRVLWAEQNPGQKLYGHLRIEQIRKMVGG